MIVAVIAFTRVDPAAAQDQPPSPEMLLNLDLFKSQGQPEEGSNTGGESLFDKIRGMNSIGMLGGNGNAPANYPVAPSETDQPVAPPPPPPPYAPQSDFGGQPE